jgi:hypothetical protein
VYTFFQSFSAFLEQADWRDLFVSGVKVGLWKRVWKEETETDPDDELEDEDGPNDELKGEDEGDQDSLKLVEDEDENDSEEQLEREEENAESCRGDSEGAVETEDDDELDKGESVPDGCSRDSDSDDEARSDSERSSRVSLFPIHYSERKFSSTLHYPFTPRPGNPSWSRHRFFRFIADNF